MKKTRKIISLFLAVLMIVSCSSYAFYAAAADVSFSYLLNSLKNEYVREPSNYDITNSTDDWNDDAANLAFSHTVHAKDNYNGDITSAAQNFYDIVDVLQSSTYGVGLYTIQMISEYIRGELEGRMSSEDARIRVDENGDRFVPVEAFSIRLDEYTMDQNSVAKLESVVLPSDATYKTVNWRSSNPSVVTVDAEGYVYSHAVAGGASVTGYSMDGTKMDTIFIIVNELGDGEELNDPPAYPETQQPAIETMPEPIYMTQYEYYKVEQIIGYFLGTASNINSANWFHIFTFEVETDIETYISDLSETMKIWESNPDMEIPISSNKYVWHHVRTWDQSGTEARYSIAPGGYEHENNDSVDTTTFPELSAVNTLFQDGGSFLTTDYSMKTNAELKAIVTSSNADAIMSVFQKYSPSMLSSLFGKKLYAIMAAYNQIKPNYSYSDAVSSMGTATARYYGFRTVRDDKTYSATTTKLNDVVNNIDSLLTNGDLNAILKMFVNTSDPRYIETGIYGAEYENAKDLLSLMIKNYLYQDKIPTMILSLIMPMIKGLIQDNVPDIAKGIIWGSLEDWDIYLENASDMASKSWNGTDYATMFPKVYQWLSARGDWLSIPEEDYESIDWDIDGNRDRFECAVDAALRAIYPVVRCAFGNEDLEQWVGIIHLRLDGIDGYDDALLPIFEALGMSKANTDGALKSGAEYRNDRNRNCVFNLTTPLLNWVENYVLANPLDAVCELLPGLSYTLTSGNIRTYLNSIVVILEVYGIDITVLDGLYGVLPENIQNALVSVNAVMQEFIKFDTNVILGYDEFGYPIYNVIDYDDNGNPVYETVDFTLPTIQDKKLQECGALVNYASISDVTNRQRVETTNNGLVLLFLLRYVFYGINYTQRGTNWNEPVLLDCFLDAAERDNELFAGVSINSLIDNIILNPEGAICALCEFFYPNETQPYSVNSMNTNFYPETYVNYRNDQVLGHGSFGANVRYSQYWTRDNAEEVVDNLDDLVSNVLEMLKVEGFEDGINGFLEDLLNENLFTNSLMSTMANAIYTLLQGLSGKVDVAAILEAMLGIKYDVETLADIMHYMLITKNDTAGVLGSNVMSEVEKAIRDEIVAQGGTEDVEWTEFFFYEKVDTGVIDEDGNPVYERGEALDWGYNNSYLTGTEAGQLGLSNEDIFFANLTALLAPAAEVLRLIFLGKDVKLFADGSANGLGVITVATYESYYYALIPLYEALSCPASSIRTYSEVFTRSEVTTTIPGYTAVSLGDLNLIEDIIAPVRGLLDAIIADPLTTVLEMVPNLMFYLLIGGINDTLNNLLHFAYIIVDIIEPILDLKSVANMFLADLSLGGLNLNLSVPLDIDFNSLFNDLLSDYVFGGLLDLDEGRLKLSMPYLDLSMLCTGMPEEFASRSGNTTVKLSSGNGADLVTVLLQFVLDTVFMNENAHHIANWLTLTNELDDFDDETLQLSFEYLNVMANDYEMPDRILNILYTVVSKLTPLSGTLAERFRVVDFSLTDLFSLTGDTDSAKFDDLKNKISALIKAKPSDNQTIIAATGFLATLQSFFAKIKAFFNALLASLGIG